MKAISPQREIDRATELANEYRRKGYVVTMPREVRDLPEFLRSFQYFPDLIARSAHENLVVEVKSQSTSGDLGKLALVAERVNAQSGWKFVLVLTNPRERKLPQVDIPTGKARELLQKSVSIGTGDEAHAEASFLMAWIALEAAVMALPENRGKRRKAPTSPWTLIRDAAIHGYVARVDVQKLNALYRTRSLLLHAGDVASPTEVEVELVRSVVRELIDAPHAQLPNNSLQRP